jgi:hypothetical protein
MSISGSLTYVFHSKIAPVRYSIEPSSPRLALQLALGWLTRHRCQKQGVIQQRGRARLLPETVKSPSVKSRGSQILTTPNEIVS